MVARLPLVVTALALSAVALTTAQSTTPMTFDGLAVGAPPPGFTIETLRQRHPGTWAITRIGTNAALHHAASDSSDGWSLALAPAAAPAALRLTARVRLADGSRAGGLVWHYQDARNFMAALLDLRDGDIELFRVTDGNRIRLEDRDGLDLDPQAWHTLRVTFEGGKTTVAIGGIRVLDRTERRHTSSTGRVGVLSHGGADAAFDDLRLEPLGRQSR